MPSREILKRIYNARIKISSASQYAVSLACTGTNNQLMLKPCSISDKMTKINYQQPHYQPALLLSSIWK